MSGARTEVLTELERLLPELPDDDMWDADWSATGSEADRDCLVVTPDGDGVCRTYGSAALRATAIGRARVIAAGFNYLPALIAVAKAAKAAIEKTANANGEVYIVDCAEWDALESALRPFLPLPDPEMAF